MNILITGCSGFVGFHLSRSLIKQSHKVFGIDNLNNYYDLNLKISRNKILLKEGIIFEKIDITNYEELELYFKNKNFDIIIHLAAQAGVRYSFEAPKEYISSNIIGTFNLLEIIKNKNDLKHFMFASTSSIYAMNEKLPFNEKDKADHQVSLYSATKKSNESLLHNYSYNFDLKITIFRFFTVYGPWGRPDMAPFKFIDCIMRDKAIDVFNYGDMWRDFTYIDDLVHSVEKLMMVIPSQKNKVQGDSISDVAPYRIVNIGNQNSVKLMDFIKLIEDITGKTFKINFSPMQAGDVIMTHADSSLLKKLIGETKSTDIKLGMENLYKWYLDFSKAK